MCHKKTDLASYAHEQWWLADNVDKLNNGRAIVHGVERCHPPVSSINGLCHLLHHPDRLSVEYEHV